MKSTIPRSTLSNWKRKDISLGYDTIDKLKELDKPGKLANYLNWKNRCP